MRKIQEHEYLWMIRLHAGPLLFLPGKEIDDALAENHITRDKMKHCMPVKYQANPVKTEEEERALKIARQERLIKARAVKKTKRAKSEKDITDTLD